MRMRTRHPKIEAASKHTQVIYSVSRICGGQTSGGGGARRQHPYALLIMTITRGSCQHDGRDGLCVCGH
jgi:hypothetical protein